MVYSNRKRNREAAELFERAYQIDLRALGPFHPRTSYAQLNYGATLKTLGRADEGRSMETQAKAVLSLVR